MLVLPILFCLTAGAFASSSSSSSSSRSSASASSSGYVYPLPRTTGRCPYIVGETLDFERMVGSWYEVQRSLNNYDSMDKCTRFVWNPPTDNNSSKLIYNSVSNLAPMTSKTISVAVPIPEGVDITYHVPTVGNIDRKRIVLSVNYDDHLILYTCEESDGQYLETAWIHSRTPKAGARIDAIRDAAFAKYNINVPEMHYQNNDDCDLYYASYDKTCS